VFHKKAIGLAAVCAASRQAPRWLRRSICPLAYAPRKGSPESAPSGPDVPRAPINSPGPENASHGGQDQDQRETEQAAPQPAAIEKQGGAEEPRREGGKEAGRDDDDATRRREAADLAAQQSMAASAVKMLDLTFAQIIVGILGIVGLGVTIYYTRETARAARGATIAARDSVVLAKDSLVLSQRPWILVDVSLGGPLRYDQNGMNITLDLVLTNTGETPAFQVIPHIVPYIRTQARFDDRAEQTKLAEDVKIRRPSRFGYTIFPKRGVSVSWTVTIPHAEIAAAHAEFEGAITFVTPFVVGTVSYVFTLSDKAHQTGIIYQLARLNPSNPRITLAIDTAAGDVPREMLALSESSLGGPYID